MKKRYLLTPLAAILLLACSTPKKSKDMVYELSDISISEYSDSEPVAEYPVVMEDAAVVEDKREYAAMRNMEETESPVMYEKEVVATDCSEISVSKSVKRGGKQQQARASLLTATEVNDFKKWDEWQELLEQDFSSYKSVWKIAPYQRFVARVSDKRQKPIVNAVVRLYDSKNNLVWSARTDNTGAAQLWANMYTWQDNQQRKYTAPYKIEFVYENERMVIENAQPYPQETNVVRMNTVSKVNKAVDIFFAIDATGSMGDELSYLQTELLDIIKKVRNSQSGLNIRMGSLVYRDNGDDYVTRKSSLSSDISQTVSFLKKQSAGGGGDYPEAVDAALYQAIEMENWNAAALSRIVFLVLDAPPHNGTQYINRVHKQVMLAAEKGIRLIPLVASGMQQDGEYLMRSIALATNGTYVTLTDDSGVGNPHAKPTTDYYRVEKLNDLIIRLIEDYTRVPQTLGQQ